MSATIEFGQLTQPLVSGQIIIPLEYRKALKITPRSLLKMIMIGENLIISPLKNKQELTLSKKIERYSKAEVAKILAEDNLIK